MKLKKITKKQLRNEAKKLRSRRLITISAQVIGNENHLFYHFDDNKEVISLELVFPKSENHVDSIIKIFPNANIFERELHDLFGIEFDGNPNMDHHLFLADEWKEGPPRRDEKNA
ncbi:MAG: NADH-quinone oxidoreductase subunit C [Nanoarchaeota archaeon]|nr:NADH-quinone oxidoreductase subunit C [Nanoarchaeota archaeon]